MRGDSGWRFHAAILSNATLHVARQKESFTNMKGAGLDSRFDKAVSWFALTLVAGISCLSIAQVVFLDAAFSQAMLSDLPRRFADFSHASRQGSVVATYRNVFAALAIAAPLCALGAMVLSGRLRHSVLGGCLLLALAVYFYVGMAISFAT